MSSPAALPDTPDPPDQGVGAGRESPTGAGRRPSRRRPAEQMTPSPAAPELQGAVEHPHERALATLDGQEAGSLAAVAWASVHLAAVGRVLYPAVLVHVPAARGRVRAQQATDRRLQHALWLLDRRVTGAQAQSQTPVALLRTQVREALQEHVELTRLRGHLVAAACQAAVLTVCAAS